MNHLSTFFSIVLIVILGNNQSLFSQNFQWATSCAKGINDDYGVISSNAAGDVFLTGKWTYPRGIFGNDTLGAGYLPVMLSKLNESGDFQWTKGIRIVGNTCSSTETFVSASKLSDNVFLYGNVCGNVYFDTMHIQSTSNFIFFAKYDNDGNLVNFLKPGDKDGCAISRATFDGQDNAFFLGYANDTVNFNEQRVFPGQFLSKFTPDGHCAMIKNINVYQGVVLQEFCHLTDGGFLLAGMTIQSSVIIETDTLTSSEIYGGDLLLVKYDSAGKYLWSKLDGKTGAVKWIFGVTNDASGNFLVTGGQIGDTLIFGNHIIPNDGSGEMFIVKYDADGNALWVANSQSIYAWTEPRALFTAADGKTYVTGGINDVYGLDTVQFGSQSLYLNGKIAMFVACYDSNGSCLGVRYAESDRGSGPVFNFTGTSVTADNNGNCIVAGQFQWNAYFDSYSLTSMGAKDIFIARCSQITGLEEFQKNEQNQLLIYANPNTGKCNITIPDEFKNENNLTLYIYDLKGKLVQQSKVEPSGGKISLNIEARAKGMYTAILSNGKKSYSGKIVFE